MCYAQVPSVSFLKNDFNETSYLKIDRTDLHQIFTIGSLDMSVLMINLTLVLRSLDMRCYGNQFNKQGRAGSRLALPRIY